MSGFNSLIHRSPYKPRPNASGACARHWMPKPASSSSYAYSSPNCTSASNSGRQCQPPTTTPAHTLVSIRRHWSDHRLSCSRRPWRRWHSSIGRPRLCCPACTCIRCPTVGCCPPSESVLHSSRTVVPWHRQHRRPPPRGPAGVLVVFVCSLSGGCGNRMQLDILKIIKIIQCKENHALVTFQFQCS